MKDTAPTIEEMPDKLSVLKRNMDVLKKEYPDLGEIEF